jgi:hypothetical protein
VRPLMRPAWNDAWNRYLVIDLVVQAFGKFCSICERYIPQDQRAWRASNGKLIQGRARPDAWQDTFVLCRTCARAARQRPLPATLLRPDLNRTFTLDDSAPFRYELRQVAPGLSVVVEGVRLLMPEGEQAVVVPTTDSAAETLRYFALDVPLQQPPTMPAVIPSDLDDDDLDVMLDPRVELRTEAWTQATAYVQRLKSESDPAGRQAFLAQVNTLIKFGGYWSVWATVLWDGFHDVELLASLLLPPRVPPSGLTATAGPALSGSADWHDGTRADWLPTANTASQGADHG